MKRRPVFEMSQDCDIWSRISLKFLATRDISVRFGCYDGGIEKKGVIPYADGKAYGKGLEI